MEPVVTKYRNEELKIDRSWEPEEIKDLYLPTKICQWKVVVTSSFGMVLIPDPYYLASECIERSPFAEINDIKAGFQSAPVAAAWVKIHPLALWAIDRDQLGMPQLRLVAQDFCGALDRPFLFDLSSVGGVFDVSPIIARMLFTRFEGHPAIPDPDNPEKDSSPATDPLVELVRQQVISQENTFYQVVEKIRKKLL